MQLCAQFIGVLIGIASLSTTAYSYSFEQAESDLLTQSNRVQASALLSQASEQEAKAVQGLGRPTVSLNMRALSYHQTADISTQALKTQLAKDIGQQLDQQSANLGNLGLDAVSAEIVNTTTHTLLNRAISRLPNEVHLDAKDSSFTPSIAVTMPIYTGGAIRSSQQIAKLGAQRQSLSELEQISLERLNLIRLYFGAKLQQALQHSAKAQYDAMQLHVNNAHQLERVGFISRGQRMQFEVARNHAQQLYQNSILTYEQSLFQLQSLLNSQHISTLTTPLFINHTLQPNWDNLVNKLNTNAPTSQKLAKDIELANERVGLAKSAKKPKVFALGEYTPDDGDWFVGIAANYTLYSGLDRDAKIQAANLQAQAATLSATQATTDLTSAMHLSYLELQHAQRTQSLLAQNKSAAIENLRIQRLAFKEGFGTVADVVDAETRLQQVESEMATNAYRYVMALANLLHHTGELDQFSRYLHRADVITL